MVHEIFFWKFYIYVHIISLVKMEMQNIEEELTYNFLVQFYFLFA